MTVAESFISLVPAFWQDVLQDWTVDFSMKVDPWSQHFKTFYDQNFQMFVLRP
jgi:hypothetical protein